MNVQLTFNNGFRWYIKNNIAVKGRVLHSNGDLLYQEKLWQYFQECTDKNNFIDRLKELNGVFSVVIYNDDRLWAAVDRLRNFPLFYSIAENTLSLADDIGYFTSGKANGRIDRSAEKVMRSFGYTLGKSTLLKNVFQLTAGEYISFEKGELERGFLYPPLTVNNHQVSHQLVKQELKEVFLRVGQRVSRQLGDRPVAIPLSGGRDSRTVALLLKLNGVENVQCFSYGNPNQIEAYKSEKVAKQLGYKWHMIDYAPYIREDYHKEEDFQKYVTFVGNGVSFPYLQEYFAGRYLTQQMKVPADTILTPGHSGDALGGSELFPDMEFFPSLENYAWKIYRKNGRLIYLPAKEKRALIREIISGIDDKELPLDHMLHAYWLLREENAKQTVNSAKVWNHFGYEYLFPLWDKELTDFFFTLPFEYKVYKQLYNETLQEMFADNNILFENETAADYTRGQRKVYFRLKLKPFLDPLLRYKSKKDPNDFFYFKDILHPLIQTLPPMEINEYNAYLAAWYIDFFKERYNTL